MRFEVKAIKGQNDIATLSLDAADLDDARLQASRLGYSVLKVTSKDAWLPHWNRPRVRFPLGLFSQELLALLQAGLNLVEAITALAEKEQRQEIKKILDGLLQNLMEGRTFSTALERFPAVFPPLYIATVRASERTGNLQDAFSRYVAYQHQIDLLRKKIVSASIYPVLLISAGGVVMLFLMAYVVPKFSGIYESAGQNIPWLSQLLLSWGKLLYAHGETVLVIFALLLAAAGYGLTRPGLRRWTGQQLWRLPAVGERMRIYQLARFYRTVGMLLRGGIPVATALAMVAGLLPPALRAQLAQATQHIRHGRSISQSLEAEGLSTPVAQRMLAVGERTGDMGEMMERIAAFYDEEIERWVDWFTRTFEPVLMAAIGLLIGIIVVLMYMPIFELAGSIQ